MFDYDYFMMVDWTLIYVNILVAVPFGFGRMLKKLQTRDGKKCLEYFVP